MALSITMYIWILPSGLIESNWDSPLKIYSGVRLLIKKNVLFCLKIFFTLTNSVDPDKMLH